MNIRNAIIDGSPGALMKYRNCNGKLKTRKGRQLKWLCKQLKQFKKQQTTRRPGDTAVRASALALAVYVEQGPVSLARFLAGDSQTVFIWDDSFLVIINGRFY